MQYQGREITTIEGVDHPLQEAFVLCLRDETVVDPIGGKRNPEPRSTREGRWLVGTGWPRRSTRR
ncbi:hypothetical protein [Streptomyces sp. NPDC005374]|uniref:hypothetical protein n=1 Tax=Streptomyces sp. NPDC005374 TaxID=3364713 RepID=UPI003687D5C0